MAKFKIGIKRVEIYENVVIVDADNLDEAVDKVDKAWQEDDYLYEKTTDLIADSVTEFYKNGLASEDDIKCFINI